jgi:hypothetical protein
MNSMLLSELPAINIIPSATDRLFHNVTSYLPPRRCYILEAYIEFRRRGGTVEFALESLIAAAPVLFSLPAPPRLEKDPKVEISDPSGVKLQTFEKRIRDLVTKKGKLSGEELNEFLQEEYPDIFYQQHIEWPLHWKIASEELREMLQDEVQVMTSNGVDVKGFVILVTDEHLMIQCEKQNCLGIIPPGSVEIKHPNFALFFKENGHLTDLESEWRCELLFIGGKRHATNDPGQKKKMETRRAQRCEEIKSRIKIALLDIFESSVENNVCISKMPNRIGPDPGNVQKMAMFGLRSSKQADRDGHHTTLHYKNNELLQAEEALGSGIMAATIEYFIEESFAGTLLKLMKVCAAYGGVIYPCRYACFTLFSLTRNYNTLGHVDTGDLAGSFIVWCVIGEGTLENQAFCISSHGAFFRPRDGDVLFIDSARVNHHSVAPTGTGTASLIGVGVAANKHVLTNLKTEFISTLKGKVLKLLTSFKDVPDRLIERPAIKNLFQILSIIPENKKRRTNN